MCDDENPEAQRSIARHRTGNRSVAAGQDLFRAGDRCDTVYNLVEGWVCLYNLLPDGRRQILHFALPGAVLGLQPPPRERASYSAQALTDVVLCVVPHDALKSLSAAEPEIGLRLARLMSRDCALSYDHLTNVGRRTAHERVAHLLLELLVRWRSQGQSSRIEEMHLPLTQEHIADAVGLTAVHVNRVLRDLRNDGVLEFHYRRLRVMDPDKLADIAGFDPELAASLWDGHGGSASTKLVPARENAAGLSKAAPNRLSGRPLASP